MLPTAYGVDPEGPDRDGTLYVHGSVAARSLVQAPSQTVCAVLVRWSRGAKIKAHTVARLLVDAVARGERLTELSTPGIPSWLSSASETVTNSPPAGDAPTQPPADR